MPSAVAQWGGGIFVQVDQEVRFSTATGRRIAYALVGEGPVLVFPAWWVSHIELTWENRAFRAFVCAIAERHHRGSL